MSRTDEFALNTPHPEEKPDTRTAHERAAEITDRLGLTREAAHREMERFGNLAEYEVRKIFGQRSALREPVMPEPKRKKSNRTAPAAEYRVAKSSAPIREAAPEESDDRQQKLALE
jgi:hypothetical protein